MESTRVDRWLWAVRLYKSRSAATSACRGGHVRVNGATAKPATAVRVGDRVEARAGRRDRVVEVVRVIVTRVGPALALECLVDHSRPATGPSAGGPAADDAQPGSGRRDAGTGRPTKRDRRHLDRIRGR